MHWAEVVLLVELGMLLAVAAAILVFHLIERRLVKLLESFLHLKIAQETAAMAAAPPVAWVDPEKK